MRTNEPPARVQKEGEGGNDGDPTAMDIERHGTALSGGSGGKGATRVRCNYCGKDVNGFSRLRHHLGAIGGDVLPCRAAPQELQLGVRRALLRDKQERLLREVGRLVHPDLPLKRKLSFSKPATSPKHPPPTPPPLSPHPPPPRAAASEPVSILEGQKTDEGVAAYSKRLGKEEEKKEEVKDEPFLHASRCVARFLLEAGLEAAVVKCPSFRQMVNAAVACGPSGFNIPDPESLNGFLLQGELHQVQGHVEDVKRSWAQTGCSILLDGWTDPRGRYLISFFAECPRGTIFLKSADASRDVLDADAMFSLLDRVVQDVGARNVVQVVSHGTSVHMQAAGKRLMERHTNLFWALSAGYCINLILERIGAMDHIKQVVTKAKSITKFIYSHELPLQLMRRHIKGKDLIRTSDLKSVAIFVTLENIISQRENLMAMFSSPAWLASMWASRINGRAVAELVSESSFWTAAEEISRATVPLISILRRSDGNDKTTMGCIYDSMDRAKEMLRTILGNEEAKFMPLWQIIDDVWDNYLHNPLHSAGYYLNPCFFYSTDFFIDVEVANGLVSCIIRMCDDRAKQDRIDDQLDAYKSASGRFSSDSAIAQRTKIPAASWWSFYGGSTPELQNLAIRVLSQNCRGSSMYKFQRHLSEQIHMKGRNPMEQNRLSDIEYVHYNMRLWQSPMMGMDPTDDIVREDIDMSDDSVIEF